MIRNPIMAADTDVVEGSKWCPRCGRSKPIEGNFYWCESEARYLSYCVACKRRYNAAHPRKRKNDMSEYLRRYNARPDQVQKRKEYRRTPMGKLVTNLSGVRKRLRRKPTDKLRASEAAIVAEIERLRGDA